MQHKILNRLFVYLCYRRLMASASKFSPTFPLYYCQQMNSVHVSDRLLRILGDSFLHKRRNVVIFPQRKIVSDHVFFIVSRIRFLLLSRRLFCFLTKNVCVTV